ncbi:MAG: hypothetical protein HQL87_02680 [Magnetococcales bacterium]|nr:hypothetical protein [Magnetococcales bacterium]
MADEKIITNPLQAGEYPLSDPAILHEMRIMREIKLPGSEAILVPRYLPITKKLIGMLRAHGIETLFAEPVEGKSVAASMTYMEHMFQTIDQIVRESVGNLEEMATSFRYRRDQEALERLVRDNLREVQDLFRSDPVEKLVALTRHHNGTARHSIIASFHMMALGRELGWSDDKIVRAAMAVFNHDVGKTRIKLETLNWPGRLNHEKWKEIQQHTLFGGLLLRQPGEPPDLLVLVALLHHEWYASVEGKGYGGASLFEAYLKETCQWDMRRIIADLDPDDLDIIQATALVDMVSALEEQRSYKRELDSVKVMIIMNSDAKLGHFDPKHYATWHRLYQRQYPNLLPVGRRVALPREKEQRIFLPLPAKKVPPLPLLTYYELETLGFLPVLQNVGMDVERIRRRGGLLLKVVEQIKQEKSLSFDCSPRALEAAGITLLKNRIIPEEQVIELEAWREWLTLDDLERCDLLPLVQIRHFDLTLIRKEGGIAPDRLTKRGIRIPEAKLNRLGIVLLKPWTIRLPASENRLTLDDLEKLGIGEAQLKKAGCLEHVQRVKSVPVPWLTERGIACSGVEMAKSGIDPIRKVFYDILVTQEINSTRARLVLLREGDELKMLEAANARNELDPIQDHLFNRIGEVVMDFADLVALPDLRHCRMGDQWGPHATR